MQQFNEARNAYLLADIHFHASHSSWQLVPVESRFELSNEQLIVVGVVTEAGIRASRDHDFELLQTSAPPLLIALGDKAVGSWQGRFFGLISAVGQGAPFHGVEFADGMVR